MNKITTYLLFFAFFASTTNATNYFLDPNGNDAKDGLSWGTAVKTIGQAKTISKAGDNVFVKTGTFYFTGSFTFGEANYYGGFIGVESDPSERILVDLDGNGIVEPWEFQYPTLFSSNYNNGSAFSLPAAQMTMNGFTFTHVASRTTAGNLRTLNCAAAFPGTFENNTIKDCNLSTTMTSSISGMLMSTAGVMKNCLFEKNQTYCSSNADVAVMLGVDALINSKISNCVFRNNKATADWSIGTTANANLRGFVLNIAPSNTATDRNVIKNCLFYNNEAVFIGNTGNPASTNGAIMALSSFSASASTDSILNCVFANNKTTSMKTAGLNVIKSGTAVKFVINNTFWNNKLDGNVKNLQIGTSLASGYIGYNIMNGGGVAGATGSIPTNAYCANNLIDMSNNNADDIKAPGFQVPTSFTGVNRIAGSADSVSIAQARWNLKEGSYLNSKGFFYNGISKDFAGNTFASTPSVGAFEYFGYYRTNAGGDWNSASTWQASRDNSTWADNTLPPTSDLNSVIIRNSNTVTVTANATAPALTIMGGGKLTLMNGKTLSAKSLVIDSDVSNGTGTFVDENTAGGLSVTGTTEVKQYFNADYPRNWYLSSPVSTATVPASNYSIWTRNEAANAWNALSSGNSLVPGTGYIVKPTVASLTYSFTGGQLNSGSVPVTLKYTEGATNAGFNMAGNPYASHISISKTMTDNANSLNTIWFRTVSSYDNTRSKYNYTFHTCVINQDGTYVGTPLGTTPVVAPMQSFWIKTSVNNSTLTFTNSIRSHQESNPLKAKSDLQMSILRIQISNSNGTDETVLYTNVNASDSFDSYDAPKMSDFTTTIPEIYSTVDNTMLAINGFSSFPVDSRIPIGFTAGETNSYSIKASGIKNISMKIILKDYLLNKETDISAGESYEFVSEPGTFENRFGIIFKSPELNTGTNHVPQNNKDNYVFITKNREIGIYSKFFANQNVNAEIFNVTGQKIAEQTIKSTFTLIPVSEKGIYLIKINQPNEKESFNIIIR